MNGGDAASQERSPARLDSPWLPAAVTAAACLIFVLARFQAHGWDPSLFVTAGDYFCNAERTPRGLTILKNPKGFDGQYYYRLALNPFTNEVVDYGIRLDSPAYRHQRIMYPLIAWALSLGRPEWAPTALVLVNFLGLCVIAWLGARFAQSLGRHALWGLVLPCYPGFLLAFARDLVEIVQMAFLLGALLLLRRERHIGATFLLVAAILTKESSYLVIPAAIIAYALEAWKEGEPRRVRWHFFIVPGLVYCLWQGFLWAWWGSPAIFTRHRNHCMPFHDLADRFVEILGLGTPEHVFYFFEVCLLCAVGMAVARTWSSSPATRLEKTAWLLYAVAAATLPRRVWMEDWGFMLCLSEYFVLGAVVFMGSRSSLKSAVFGGSAALWLALALARR